MAPRRITDDHEFGRDGTVVVLADNLPDASSVTFCDDTSLYHHPGTIGRRVAGAQCGRDHAAAQGMRGHGYAIVRAADSHESVLQPAAHQIVFEFALRTPGPDIDGCPGFMKSRAEIRNPIGLLGFAALTPTYVEHAAR